MGILLFSGQGSQYYQMGHELIKSSTIFSHWIKEGCSIASEILKLDLYNEIYQERTNRFNPPFTKTLLTHPSIFIFEYALFKHITEEILNEPPKAMLGYSLGEFVMYAASGLMKYEESLKLILQQASLMENLCEPGSMLAILNSPQLIDNHPTIFKNVEIAAINLPNHFVVTGKKIDITLVEKQLKAIDVIALELPVQRAFHSKYMDPIKNSLEDYCKNISLNPANLIQPKLALYICSQVSNIQSLIDKNKCDILNLTWSAIRKPVFFEETMQLLEQEISESNHLYIDIGAAGTLATFCNNYFKSRNSSIKAHMTITPMGNDLKRLKQLKERVAENGK
ncbi:MAG: acyltransferase domain-containing protein [Bacteriovoracaceae bacterium]